MLHHSAWMRRLARRLVPDDSRADDIVQEVWLVALRARPNLERDLRSWLSSVARKVAIGMKRSEERRRRREKIAARADSPTLKTPLPDLYLQEKIVRHVLRLEEPYRSTMLQHFYEGLSSQEIARRHSIPSATVRTRLRRGLATLRSRLDREFGDPNVWRTALLPLARGGPGAAPLPVGAGPGPALVPASLGRGAFRLGGWNLRTQFAAALLAAAGALVGLVVAMDPQEEEPGRESRGLQAPADRPLDSPPPGSPGRAEPAADVPRASERREVQASPPVTQVPAAPAGRAGSASAMPAPLFFEIPSPGIASASRLGRAVDLRGDPVAGVPIRRVPEEKIQEEFQALEKLVCTVNAAPPEAPKSFGPPPSGGGTKSQPGSAQSKTSVSQPSAEEGAGEVLSGPDGTFVPPEGSGVLRASGEEHWTLATGWVLGAASEKVETVALCPGIEVSGSVVDLARGPLEAAVVQVSVPLKGIEEPLAFLAGAEKNHAGDKVAAVTDPGGRFTLERAPETPSLKAGIL